MRMHEITFTLDLECVVKVLHVIIPGKGYNSKTLYKYSILASIDRTGMSFANTKLKHN
jgi:hypothetical protein